jgi:hypothetical protein
MPPAGEREGIRAKTLMHLGTRAEFDEALTCYRA